MLDWLISAVILLAVGQPGASPSAPPTKFDLVCTGTKTMLLSKATEAWSMRYRIDLDQATFCLGECSSPIAIEKIEPNRILFSETRDRLYSMTSYVDRTTGELTQRAGFFLPAMAHESFSVSASCVREPFSGLPTTKF